MHGGLRQRRSLLTNIRDDVERERGPMTKVVSLQRMGFSREVDRVIEQGIFLDDGRLSEDTWEELKRTTDGANGDRRHHQDDSSASGEVGIADGTPRTP
jgi:hypothetical protein